MNGQYFYFNLFFTLSSKPCFFFSSQVILRTKNLKLLCTWSFLFCFENLCRRCVLCTWSYELTLQIMLFYYFFFVDSLHMFVGYATLLVMLVDAALMEVKICEVLEDQLLKCHQKFVHTENCNQSSTRSFIEALCW